MAQKYSNLSLVGFILGILGLILSFVPCVGIFAPVLGLVGLILAILGYRQDKSNVGTSTTMGLLGIIFSILAIAIGGFQAFYLGKMGSDMSKLDKEYTDCEVLYTDYVAANEAIASISDKGEDVGMSDISDMMKAGVKVGLMEKKAGELECFNDEEFKAKWNAAKVEID